MLLKDVELEKQLRDKGYVVVPFFDEAVLAQIRTFYHTIHPSGIPPEMHNRVHMTIWCKDRDYKQNVRQFLKARFQSALDRYLISHRSMNHNFIIKLPGEESVFMTHQDWSVVDENIYESANVWVAIEDTTTENGTLCFHPGSHKNANKIRGGGALFSPIDQVGTEFIDVPLKAGEAIIFYHSVFHGSKSNLSNAPRIVAYCGIVPEEAPLQIYFQKDKQSNIEIYEPEDNFAYEYLNAREDSMIMPPKGRLVKSIRPEDFKLG